MEIRLLEDGTLQVTETPITGGLERLWRSGKKIELHLPGLAYCWFHPVSYAEATQELKKNYSWLEAKEIEPVATLILHGQVPLGLPPQRPAPPPLPEVAPAELAAEHSL